MDLPDRLEKLSLPDLPHLVDIGCLGPVAREWTAYAGRLNVIMGGISSDFAEVEQVKKIKADTEKRFVELKDLYSDWSGKTI